MGYGRVRIYRIAVLALFLAVLLGCAYDVPDTLMGQQEELKKPEKPEITIWVDSGNELPVRMALGVYERGRSELGASEYGSYFPELTWNLLDKSYLTKEQLQQELARELEEGGGPDLIFMDEVNGIGLGPLMQNGKLLELENVVGKYVEYDLSYLDGTLEQGQMDGKQYVLPVTVQCPVVFGLEDTLAQAGADMEEGYATLEEFLEAMVEASETSGKQIFEDVSAVDWLEQYAMPQTLDEWGMVPDREKLETLFRRVREHSGTEDGFFGPYESLGSGDSLLSGCGFSEKTKMAQNLALLGADRAVFLAVPAWDGEVRAVITLAAAVNANTAFPKEAAALLQAFQSFPVNNTWVQEAYPALAVDAYWKSQLEEPSSLAEMALKPEYAAIAEKVLGTGPAGRRFLACTKTAVTDAVYQAAASEADADAAMDIPQKDVLTVGFGTLGMGSQYPLYQWLADVAERYSDDSLHVQLVPVPDANKALTAKLFDMEKAKAGLDVILDINLAFENDAGYGFSSIPADLTPYLEKSGEPFRTMDLSGQPKGLVYGIENIQGKEGRQYVFVVSGKSSLKEEAFGFCAAALKDEGYAQAVQAAGLMAYWK